MFQSPGDLTELDHTKIFFLSRAMTKEKIVATKIEMNPIFDEPTNVIRCFTFEVL